MKTIPFNPIPSVETMRKFAIGAWSNPTDPTASVQLDVDVTAAMNYVNQLPHCQFKHVLIKAFSCTLKDIPELNRVIIRRRLRQRSVNRLFIPTVFRYKRMVDLNGISMDDAYAMSVTQIAETMSKKVSELRTLSTPRLGRVIRLFHRLPSGLTNALISIISFVQYTCNVSLSMFGLPVDPFGSMMITFLDKFDIRYAHIPLYPFSRTPITISVGAMVQDHGRYSQPLVCTFDHRCFDGYVGAKAIKRLRYYMAYPEALV